MNESVGVIHTKTIQCNQLYITKTQGWTVVDNDDDGYGDNTHIILRIACRDNPNPSIILNKKVI